MPGISNLGGSASHLSCWAEGKSISAPPAIPPLTWRRIPFLGISFFILNLLWGMAPLGCSLFFCFCLLTWHEKCSFELCTFLHSVLLVYYTGSFLWSNGTPREAPKLFVVVFELRWYLWTTNSLYRRRLETSTKRTNTKLSETCTERFWVPAVDLKWMCR